MLFDKNGDIILGSSSGESTTGVTSVNGSSGPAVTVSVNGQTTTTITLTASDVGAVSTQGDTVTGNLVMNGGSVSGTGETLEAKHYWSIIKGFGKITGYDCSAASYGIAQGTRVYVSGVDGTSGIGQFLSLNTTGNKTGFVVGQFNDNTKSNLSFAVGNGTGTSARSNAFEVDNSGNTKAAGDMTVTINGTEVSISSLLARIEALEAK